MPSRSSAGGRLPSRRCGSWVPDPVSGRPMIIKDGRFGAYVTDGETNATLRRGDEIATITPERAAELLAEKRAKGPAPKKKAAARRPAGAAKKTASNGTGSARKPAAKKVASRQR